MSYTFEDFRRDLARKMLKEMPLDERLEGLPPEERLKGLPPEERLRGLSPEERLQGLSDDELARLARFLKEQGRLDA